MMNQQQSVPPMPANTRIQFQGSFVTSFEEVKSFPCPLNGQIILIDTINRRMYIKGLDSIGNPMIETYSINNVDSGNKDNQHVINKTSDSVKIQDSNKLNEDFIKRLDNLEDQIKSLNKIMEGFKI